MVVPGINSRVISLDVFWFNKYEGYFFGCFFCFVQGCFWIRFSMFVPLLAAFLAAFLAFHGF